VLAKGRVIGPADAESLCELAWDELHVIAPEPGDIHESVAGTRLAQAAAGRGVTAGASSGGHWPLSAAHRGLLAVRREALRLVNRLEGVAVYTLYDGQVVDAGEKVGRAKIVPFVIAGEVVAHAENVAREALGVVEVRPFAPTAIGTVVQESLGERGMARFRDALSEKVSWFGSRLLDPCLVVPESSAIATAIDELAGQGARIVVLAGSRPMDPLDPVFQALARVGARIERRGVPAHPGSLLWLARLREIPIVGMPSCGLFSQATVFDLVLPRLLAGELVDADWLCQLGHGGFLTRDMAFRFPPYRPARARGEVA